MNFVELVEVVKKGKVLFVEFTENIEDCESYFDVNMRAKIILAEMDDDGDTVRILFNFEQFTELNDGFEKSNYWDKNGGYTWSAKQAGYYPKDFKAEIWFNPPDPVDRYFRIVESNMEVYEKYLSEKKEGQSYTEWLEEVVSGLF